MNRLAVADSPLSRRRVLAGAASCGVSPWPGAIAQARDGQSPPFDSGGPTLSFATAQRSSGVQPLGLDAASHLRVRASIRGASVSAILDTGAARTVIDRAFAQKLGLARRPGFNVAGVTDNVQGDFAEDVSISIGALTLDHLTPGLLDLSRIAPPAGEPAAMIIGRELFQRTAADFDFANRSVAFVDVSAPLDLPARSTVSLGQTARGTPHVPVSLDGMAPIEAGLDIGYNASILLSAEYAHSAGIGRSRPWSTVASVGAEGLSISRVTTVERLTLAGTTLRDAPVEIPAAWNRSIPAIIGLDIIRKFRMLTDYPHQRIGLFADRLQATLPLPKDRSGIGAVPTRSGLDVIHVAEGSPAERGGLKAGDRIEAINGETVDLDYIRRHPRMGTGAVGTAFVLGLADGRAVNMTLAEYY